VDKTELVPLRQISATWNFLIAFPSINSKPLSFNEETIWGWTIPSMPSTDPALGQHIRCFIPYRPKLDLTSATALRGLLLRFYCAVSIFMSDDGFFSSETFYCPCHIAADFEEHISFFYFYTAVKLFEEIGNM
jgi:hypothetical protein